MQKKIVLLSMLLGASLAQAVTLPDGWQASAQTLITRIAGFPAKFQADTVLYNDTTDRLHLMMTIFADEIDNITTVFTCLREKYAALNVSYNQVLVDTEISIEDAAIKKLLLQGELQDLIETTDAQIATLESERDALLAERNLLQANYDELVGDASDVSNELSRNVHLILDSYDEMVAAKANMISKLGEFKDQLTSMFTALDVNATQASNEIC